MTSVHVPASVTYAYEEEAATIEALRAIAGPRLRVVAADHNWLFDDRIKSPESCLSKLEAGVNSLAEISDFYGAMIVVPTQKEVDRACEAVLASLAGEVRQTKTSEASSFVYDDVHVLARLRGKVSPRAAHAAVLDRTFEVQIHTGVQYAWWRATHDELYKGSSAASRSWGSRRASGQARATLEFIDGVLSDFHLAAQLQRPMPEQSDPAEPIVAWLHTCPRGRRPSDEVRFTKTAHALITDAGITIPDVLIELTEGLTQDLVSNHDVTLIQAIIVACHRISGDQLFHTYRAHGRRLLITEELIAAYGPIVNAPVEIRVCVGG